MKACPKASRRKSARRLPKFPDFVHVSSVGKVSLDPEAAFKWFAGKDRGEPRSLLELGALVACALVYGADNSRKGEPAEALLDSAVAAAALGMNEQDRKYLYHFLGLELGGLA